MSPGSFRTIENIKSARSLAAVNLRVQPRDSAALLFSRDKDGDAYDMNWNMVSAQFAHIWEKL